MRFQPSQWSDGYGAFDVDSLVDLLDAGVAVTHAGMDVADTVKTHREVSRQLSKKKRKKKKPPPPPPEPVERPLPPEPSPPIALVAGLSLISLATLGFILFRKPS